MNTPDTVRDHPHETPVNPIVVLIGLDSTLQGRLQDYFTQRGWRVERAVTASEGRRLARRFRARVVVLPPDLPEETGWIAAAKMRLEPPEATVVVVLEEADLRARRMAHFIGARILFREDKKLTGLSGLLSRPQPVGTN